MNANLRAVWSFWSKPHLAGWRSEWASDFHQALAWCLSVELARRHYPDTQLVTDDRGARWLVGDLGLPFTHVSTVLNELKDIDPHWWSLGKMVAYALQDRPFVHIDADAFLWKALPERVTGAPVFTQHPEPVAAGQSYQRPEELERSVSMLGGWLPDEWYWYRVQRLQRGEGCGIFGGNHFDFIRYYAELGLDIVRHPRNQAALASLPHKDIHMFEVEQYLIAACVEYQRAHSTEFRAVTLANIFGSLAQVFDPNIAEQVGLIHLMSTAKRHPVLMRKLEARVWRDFPEHYARCIGLVKRG